MHAAHKSSGLARHAPGKSEPPSPSQGVDKKTVIKQPEIQLLAINYCRNRDVDKTPFCGYFGYDDKPCETPIGVLNLFRKWLLFVFEAGTKFRRHLSHNHSTAAVEQCLRHENRTNQRQAGLLQCQTQCQSKPSAIMSLKAALAQGRFQARPTTTMSKQRVGHAHVQRRSQARPTTTMSKQRVGHAQQTA